MVDVFALRLTLSSYESLLPFSRSSETWQQRPDNSEQEKKKKSELSVGLMRVRRMLTLLATYDTPTTEIETTAHRFWPLRWSSWASWRRENEWRKLFLFCPVLQRRICIIKLCGLLLSELLSHARCPRNRYHLYSAVQHTAVSLLLPPTLSLRLPRERRGREELQDRKGKQLIRESDARSSSPELDHAIGRK